MSGRKLFAVALIFVIASIAWIVLSSTLQYRTASLTHSLSEEVNSLWGPSDLVQTTPYLLTSRRHLSPSDSAHRREPLQTRASVNFEHHNRYKGLLWFSTYTANFSGEYLVQMPAEPSPSEDPLFVFNLPRKATFFENLTLTLDGQPVEPEYLSQPSRTSLLVALPAGGNSHRLAVSFATRGRDSWRYALSRPGGQVQVKDFTLKATTNFRDINYPGDCMSPDTPATDTNQGLEVVWKLGKMWTSQNIGIEMPARHNAGPIAARMSLFAPVGLFFFFTVLFTIVVLKNIPLHPMHYLFISAGFFAFHILLAYLVDIVSIRGVFWICAAVSVFLVVSYMRLVAGVKFAVLYVGLAQLVYLVGFSYAFLFPEHTGRAVVIGAVVTLFVLMQATGRVDWQELFKKPSLPSPEPGKVA